MPSRCDQATA
ncbi:hypothetical protein MRX96_022695 [Rhipicephalus microplus]